MLNISNEYNSSWIDCSATNIQIRSQYTQAVKKIKMNAQKKIYKRMKTEINSRTNKENNQTAIVNASMCVFAFYKHHTRPSS